jgi:hypothetical protein
MQTRSLRPASGRFHLLKTSQAEPGLITQSELAIGEAVDPRKPIKLASEDKV